MVQEKQVSIVEQAPKPAPRITPQAIQERKEQITLLQGMVKDLLIRSVDYGRIPGTPQDSLWDPGASQIIGSFNCYPGERRILKFEDTEKKISVCIEVPIVSRETGQVAATGIGAASTLETKYKYRWVDKPADWGYEGEEVKKLKTKTERGKTLYRIPNPEHSELFNTIIKMASKRAEVDAAESLPGVASILRQMFGGQLPSKPSEEGSNPRWTWFWGEVRRLGLTEQEAHSKLGVTSMKDWLSSGRSLDGALDILRREEGVPEDLSPPGSKPKRDPETIKTTNAMYKALNEDYGLQPDEVNRELNVSSTSEISELPSECYRKIAAVR